MRLELFFDHLNGRTVDLLVNNAGFATYGSLATSDPDEISSEIGVNVVALTELTQLLLPGMLKSKRGTIINLASTAAFLPGPMMAVYFATKAYVLSLSVALAEELRGSGVDGYGTLSRADEDGLCCSSAA